MFLLPQERTYYESCEAKKKNRSVRRNWVQEAESDEDKVFNVYH